MVRKIYNSLILFFLIAVLIFYGNNLATQEFDEITNKYFNSTVYLKTAVSQQDTIKILKIIANEYDLTIAKVLANDSDGTDIYVYSNNNRYAHDILSSYLYDSELAAIGKMQTFYNKDIGIKPLDELENIGVEGRYALHISDSLSLEDLVKELNSKYSDSLTIYPNQNLQNTFGAYTDNLNYYFTMIVIGTLLVTLFTSFLYDLNSRKKEIAIKRLFGYGTKDIFFDIFKSKALLPIALSLLCSELIVIIFFVLNKNIKSLDGLQNFIFGSMRYVMFFAAALIAIFAIILVNHVANKTLKTPIVVYIKGVETSRNILSILVKMGSTLIIIVFFGVLFISFSFVSDKQAAIQQWERTKDYATLNFYVPEYIFQDKKNSAEFEQTHRIVWNYLNEKNGIMFYKRYEKINVNPIVIDNNEIDVPFAYINDNYLKENLVLDVAGNKIIALDQSDDNQLNVLVPMMYKPYEEELRQIIHQTHVFDKYISEDVINEWITGEKNSVDYSKENLNNPNITEKFIYIKDNQALFTYAPGGDFIMDGILAVVNAENMGLNVYTPSIVGESSGLKIKYSDINVLNKEVKSLFSDLGYGEVDTDFSSTYQQYANDVQYFKNMMTFSLIVFALSVIFLIFSLIYYLEVYYLNNKKIIAVKNVLGYGFCIRNMKIFTSLLIQDTLIITLGVMTGCFINSKVVGLQMVQPILAISLAVLFFDIWFAVLILKRRESKFIVKTLKGE